MPPGDMPHLLTASDIPWITGKRNCFNALMWATVAYLSDIRCLDLKPLPSVGKKAVFNCLASHVSDSSQRPTSARKHSQEKVCLCVLSSQLLLIYLPINHHPSYFIVNDSADTEPCLFIVLIIDVSRYSCMFNHVSST